MTKQKRLVVCILALAALLSLSLPTAHAEDREFKAISAHLKTRYKAKKKGIPFLGLASFAVKLVRPAGVKSIKVMIFEDLDHSGDVKHTELSAVIRQALDEQWQPLVRVFSRKDNRQVFVYAREEGADVKILAVTVERSEAVVARVKISPATLAKWMENPEILGISLMAQR